MHKTFHNVAIAFLQESGKKKMLSENVKWIAHTLVRSERPFRRKKIFFYWWYILSFLNDRVFVKLIPWQEILWPLRIFFAAHSFFENNNNFTAVTEKNVMFQKNNEQPKISLVCEEKHGRVMMDIFIFCWRKNGQPRDAQISPD